MAMSDDVMSRGIEYVRELFRDNADGHDADHSIRVYRNAVRIAAEYQLCSMQIVSLGALLHDVDDYKLFQTENNANARRFLSSEHIDDETAEAICKVINGVSFSKNRDKKPETLEGQIVQDADRLDAIGAVGIARVFAYGGKHGRTIDVSIQHFYEKLLLLEQRMNTDMAKKIARERHQFMLDFLREYEKETE